MIFSTKRFGQGYFDSESKHLFNSFQEGQAIVRSVTSRYHGSKISGSQQTDRGANVIFLRAIIHRIVIHVIFFFRFSAIFAGPSTVW